MLIYPYTSISSEDSESVPFLPSLDCGLVISNFVIFHMMGPMLPPGGQKVATDLAPLA